MKGGVNVEKIKVGIQNYKTNQRVENVNVINIEVGLMLVKTNAISQQDATDFYEALLDFAKNYGNEKTS